MTPLLVNGCPFFPARIILTSARELWACHNGREMQASGIARGALTSTTPFPCPIKSVASTGPARHPRAGCTRPIASTGTKGPLPLETCAVCEGNPRSAVQWVQTKVCHRGCNCKRQRSFIPLSRVSFCVGAGLLSRPVATQPRMSSVSEAPNMAINPPKRRQPSSLPASQASLKFAPDDSRAALGIVLAGADGNAGWMRECLVEWPRRAPRLEYYAGDAPNFAHSLEHRLRHQVLHLRRDLTETLAAYAGEWWVSFDTSLSKAENPCNSFRTIVHYRADDKRTEGALAALRSLYRHVRTSWATDDAPEFKLIADLPPSQLSHEVVVETVLPERFAPGSEATRIGGCWFRATQQAAYIHVELARALKA